MAEYLIKPAKEKGWVFCNENLNKKDIKNMLINSQLFISDLDYTLADSPTAAFIRKNFFKNIKTIGWGMEFFFKYFIRGKGTEQFIWNKYFETFPKDIDKMECKKDNVIEILYPGVIDFFVTLKKRSPEQKKILVTRTAHRIALPYKDILWFDHACYQKDKKENQIKRFAGNIKRVSLAGDSAEDEKMLKGMDNHNLCYCLGIYVVSSPKKINERFSINIGRNWGGLARILQE